VLTLQAHNPPPINGVTDVVVTAFKGTTLMKALTYTPAAPFDLAQTSTNETLSVSFTDGVVGTVTLEVEARNAAGCTIGLGVVDANIKKGGRVDVTVPLDAENDCSHLDGGGGDGAAGGTFPGCDPVPPTCAAGDTCQVNCSTSRAECTLGGTGAPGTACLHNSDCSPGSQCFDYSLTGCPVQLCLRFCDSAAQCAPASDGGVGPGSVCAGPVQCKGAATGYHTCTFSCDPRNAAVAAGGTGCPAGLACLVVGSMDQVDCACPEATRTKHEGETCSGSADCAPGLICLLGSQTCRAICRCDAQSFNCTANAGDCPSGTRCSALTNDTIYGVCLP
jgi:hypothetical protein